MHATRRVWCQALGRLVSIGLLVLGATAAGAAPPEAPTPVAPSGTISGSSYTFTWEAVADATWYYVWLNDASAAPKLAKWYTTAQAHCPEGTGGCFVTLTVGLAPGGARWFVAAYNADGQTWGPAMDFTVASAGTITGVTAGTGLTGGGTSGAVSLAVNTGAIQARVTGACAGGSAVAAIGATGTVSCQAVWAPGGNAGTNPATQFLGTTDGAPLEFRVSSQRAWQLQPVTLASYGFSPNVVGGPPVNAVMAGVGGATIAGGGSPTGCGAGGSSPCPNRVTDSFGTIGGGANNQAGDGSGTTADRSYATIGGGSNNTASGYAATVGGGSFNTASGFGATVAGGDAGAASQDKATVGGGNGNQATSFAATVAGGQGNEASASYAAVGGGTFNTASAGLATVAGGNSNKATGLNGTVPGGSFNTAQGAWSFAAGTHAKANHDGAFVWADSSERGADFASTAADQFLVRANGGARLVTGASTFTGTQAAFQVEHNGGAGEGAWLRTVSASKGNAVVRLIKHPTPTANFLECQSYDGTTAMAKCHITSAGSFVAGSDFAEALPARGGKAAGYEPGDVLVLSGEAPGTVEKAGRPYDTRVAGVYSTRPGVLGAEKGGATRVDLEDVPVAVVGIVPTKVTAENGAIRAGDLLTTAGTPGHAMRASAVTVHGIALYPTGAILGKALEGLEAGAGVIRVLVTLH